MHDLAYKLLEIELRASPEEVARQLHYQLRDFTKALMKHYEELNGAPLNIECRTRYDR